MRPRKRYNNPELAEQPGGWEPAHWERKESFGSWMKEVGRKVFGLGRGFFRPVVLVIPLLMLPGVLRRDRWMQLAGAMLLFFMIGISGITWKALLHYAAPFAPLTLVLLLACMMRMV